jgi:hypothetical protein
MYGHPSYVISKILERFYSLFKIPSRLETIFLRAQPAVACRDHGPGFARPAASLQGHWSEGQAVTAIREGHWDYVVLKFVRHGLSP